MDEVIQGLGKFLQADVPMAMGAAFLAFVVSYFLPAPQDRLEPKWYQVDERYKVIPMAVAFVSGIALGVALDPDGTKEVIMLKARGGIQTGFMAVGIFYPVRMFLQSRMPK